MKILITGGAGFIGSHLTDRLLKEGHDITILDNLSGNNGKKPDYLNPNAKFILGDIKDRDLVQKIISKSDIIFHEASSVGIAQSNYEVNNFVNNNCGGTANLLQAIIDSKTKPKLIISCSNTTYGEGLYHCDQHGTFHPDIRTTSQVDEIGFEPICTNCKKIGLPIPVPEIIPLNCNSVYALSKKFQEESAMLLGKMYEFPVILLKYFNVFGPRQSLSNPYTGVSAIFMSRVKNGGIPLIYEDGKQTRDFISIHDVVEANVLAMNHEEAKYETFNIGSGKPTSIEDLARNICKLYGKEPQFKITRKFRKGDIRHCIAETLKIRQKLGWRPRISLEEGLEEIYEWAKNQKSEDNLDKADNQLKEKGLI
jgi:dTDP-L-rhamnose 4-epimerase